MVDQPTLVAQENVTGAPVESVERATGSARLSKVPELCCQHRRELGEGVLELEDPHQHHHIAPYGPPAGVLRRCSGGPCCGPISSHCSCLLFAGVFLYLYRSVWRNRARGLDQPPLDPNGQGLAAAALRSFVRAVTFIHPSTYLNLHLNLCIRAHTHARP